MSSKADNASAARDDGTNTSEVLVKLKDKVVLGREIPSQFSSPPWRVPVKSHAKADVINRILDRSMSVQSATIPGTDDFEDFIVSNSSMAVCGLLRTYLHAVLGKEVADQTKVTLGVFKWDPSARESEVDYEGSPYLWLQVLDHPIDNTYVDIPKNDNNLEFFYKARLLQSYVKENPATTKMRLYQGQEDGLRETVTHNYKVYQEYGNNNNVEKFIIFTFKVVDLNPSMKMYDILMRDFLKKEFGVEPENLETKWMKRCWECGKEPASESELKTCVGCKKAKYCSKECQTKEWKIHKMLHKELDLTKKVLEEAAEKCQNVFMATN